MPQLVLEPAGIRIEVRAGTRLTDAIRAAGLPIAAPCGDDLICARCAVEILAGRVGRESRIEREIKARNRIPAASRLACAIRMRGDLTVTAGYWGDSRAQPGSSPLAAASGEVSHDGPPEAADAPPSTAWILIDHGSRRPEAHAHLETLADALRERAPHRQVYPAHLELVEPTLEQAIERCLRDGHRRADLFPLFLAPGRHVTHDLPERVERARRAHPDLELDLLEPLGTRPEFTDWILETLLRASPRS